MSEYEKQLLDFYCQGQISTEKFLAVFPENLEKSPEYLKKAADYAIASLDASYLDNFVSLMFQFDELEPHLEVLNTLLITPWHYRHQAIARVLQDIASPETVPYVRKVLEMGFDFLAYTFSESEVIGKWLSWVLYSIGTAEAIELMREYADSEDEGLAEAMRYRLNKVQNNTKEY